MYKQYVLPVAGFLMALVLGSGSAAAQVVFNVSFDSAAQSAFSQIERNELTSHIQAAGQRWMSTLGISASRSIEIEVRLDNSFPRASAASEGSVFVVNDGTRDVYIASVASEIETGVDPNGATPDGHVNISEDYLRNELWFDPAPEVRSAPVPEYSTDAMSVMLHELGHVLGFNGWANGIGIPPATYWSTFDRWMQSSSPTLFAGPLAVSTWGGAPDLTTNNIHHLGNGSPLNGSLAPQWVVPGGARSWKNGAPVPLDVHETWSAANQRQAPTGVLDTPPSGLVSDLMNGVVFYRGYRYDVSALDVAILNDIGLVGESEIFADGFESGN